MICPKILVTSLATLLVCTSAIPQMKQINEQAPDLEDSNRSKLLVGSRSNLADYNRNGTENVVVGMFWNNHPRVHNLTLGNKTAENSPIKDRLLFSANIIKRRKFLWFVSENVVVESSNLERISFIEALDLHSNQDGAGYVKVVSGGLGYTSVTIKLKSAWNHGIDNYVQVFSHYNIV